MTALQLLGVLGSLLLAYSAVPQAIGTVRAGKHLGTPLTISGSIMIGIVIMNAYLFLSHGFDWILTAKFVVEAVSWGILLFYGLFRR